MRYDVFRSCAKWNRSPASGAVFAILTLVVGLSAGSRPGPAKATSTDPALLVPWTRIGDIALGKSKARVQREYGSPGHGFHVIQRYGNALQGFYRLHGSKVVVTFYGEPRRRVRVRYALLPHDRRIWRRQPDPARSLSPNSTKTLRSPLARIRLQRVVEGEAVRLLDQGRPRAPIASGHIGQLLETVVHHLRRARTSDRVRLRLEICRLRQAGRPSNSVFVTKTARESRLLRCELLRPPIGVDGPVGTARGTIKRPDEDVVSVEDDLVAPTADPSAEEISPPGPA